MKYASTNKHTLCLQHETKSWSRLTLHCRLPLTQVKLKDLVKKVLITANIITENTPAENRIMRPPYRLFCGFFFFIYLLLSATAFY